jgi:hypothetical protein
MASDKLGLIGILFFVVGGFVLTQVFYGIVRNSFGEYSFMNFFGVLGFLAIGVGIYFIVQSGKTETK